MTLLSSLRRPREVQEKVIEKQTIDPTGLELFPTRLIESDLMTGCVICLDSFRIGERLSTLPCEHEYHTECINPWLIHRSTVCPLCKYDCSNDLPLKNKTFRIQTSTARFGPTIPINQIEEFSQSWMARSLPRHMRRQIDEAAEAFESVELPTRMQSPTTRLQWHLSLKRKISNLFK